MMGFARKVSTVLLGAALGFGVLPVGVAVGVLPVGVLPVGVAVAGPAGSTVGFLGGVTLITGDHVSVRRAGSRLLPAVEPGPGRSGVQFAVTQADDSLLVVPSDAWAAVNAGRLDRRLFDVALLLRDGFGDAGRSDLPLIMHGGQPGAPLSTLDLAVVRPPKSSLAEFWAMHRGGRIWLDGLREPALDQSVPRIGAPSAWRIGLNGKDVPVAVLDTGIDDTHPDFRGRLQALQNFTSDPDTHDTVGHGTHVASTIAGTGRASDGKFVGVAPGARLLIGKVCQGGGCPESAILAGMEWAVASGAKVVNLSLGGPDTADDDPLEQAVNRLSAAHGTLFVIAAGNDGGQGAETVSSPATADAALAVGAVDKQDVLAGFSGRGPRVHDAALKPEIVAPGVDITAARSRFSTLGKKGDRYVSLTGTSMATPHVAGAAAILAQQHPDWSGGQLKSALMASAHPLDGVGTYEQGAGRVDVARAVTQAVSSLPAGVSMGRPAWPHEDDLAVTRTVLYQNPGASPLALRLSVAAVGPSGSPVPPGMFALSTSDILVPAGGQASVDVTVNTALPADEGTFGAHILAVGGGVQVSTPVAVDREPESYDLTLRPVDGAGVATDLNFTFVFGVDRHRYRPVPTVDTSGTLRVRRGVYNVDTVIATPRADGLFNSSKVVHPTVSVVADTTLTLDARSAAPISVGFDRGGVRDRVVAAGYSRFTPDAVLFTGVLGDTFDRIRIGQVGDPVGRQDLVADISGMWTIPDASGDVTRSTVTYNLAWFNYGSLPTGFSRHVVDADLAAVDTTYRAQQTGKRATKVWIAREPELGIAVGQGFAFRLPLRRMEFHNVDNLQWSASFEQWSFVKKLVHTELVQTSGVADHQPGQVYADSWNSAVFGPGFAGDTDWAFRADDTLFFNVPMYSDSAVDHFGTSEMTSGSTALYQNGVKVGDTAVPGFGQFEVTPEPAAYRLETQATRDVEISAYSRTISAVWTFTSAHPPDPDPKGFDKGKGGNALPTMGVRFAPPNLNLDNEVPAGAVAVPVTVQRPVNAPEATLAELGVEVSLDDGARWQAVAVTRDPGVASGTVLIDHPGNARYVSLRARAVDSAGNTVEQTILRAYGIR
jgi:subtilisin family serine protease